MKTAGPTTGDFVISREFDGPRELVWRAWTEPAHLARWWGPRIMSTPVCEMEVRKGGAYRIVMRGPDGTDYPIRGVFLEMAPPARLVMTMDCTEHPAAWHQMVKAGSQAGENPSGILHTTVTFEEVGRKNRPHHPDSLRLPRHRRRDGEHGHERRLVAEPGPAPRAADRQLSAPGESFRLRHSAYAQHHPACPGRPTRPNSPGEPENACQNRLQRLHPRRRPRRMVLPGQIHSD